MSFFKAIDNSLIEYEEDELDLGQRGIISDQLNEYMAAARKYKLEKML